MIEWSIGNQELSWTELSFYVDTYWSEVDLFILVPDFMLVIWMKRCISVASMVTYFSDLD
jgi:hypothetical protein